MLFLNGVDLLEAPLNVIRIICIKNIYIFYMSAINKYK
ncbi:hypothetical protein HMPREF1249_1367 [Jonquetella sp. BV3C21]|nr:hypothetical protein HMPREF1249_1367 [Jonquetella sp. BV3C21]